MDIKMIIVTSLILAAISYGIYAVLDWKIFKIKLETESNQRLLKYIKDHLSEISTLVSKAEKAHKEFENNVSTRIEEQKTLSKDSFNAIYKHLGVEPHVVAATRTHIKLKETKKSNK